MFTEKRKTLILAVLCAASLLSACCKTAPAAPAQPTATPAAETAAPQEQAQQPAPQEETAAPQADAAAPVEYETADGFMASFLRASDRELIGTFNEYGVFYRVVYAASLEGDELKACGSMDYRNFKGQDPITISSDLTHVFKVDENTEYRKGTETGDQTITKEEFAELLESRKDSGMYFEVELSGGVVKSAYLTMQ